MMNELRLPSNVEHCERILVSGAGGGFDVYAGVAIYERLRRLGKKAFLSNLSFTLLEATNAEKLGRALYVVQPTTTGADVYFPERGLSQFLSSPGNEVDVYAIAKLGVVPVREAYTQLVESLRLDAIVLVDGGTDILLRGDEQQLGTPAEDMTSLAAVAALELPTRLVACVGFGIDTFHGVCHANWLENVSALIREDALLGVTALLKTMPEVELYLRAVEAAECGVLRQPSIVNASIASAIEGHFGDYHRGPRTHDSTLFINPLMNLLWMFDLPAVARRNLYLSCLAQTETIWDVHRAITEFHSSIRHRPPQTIPH
ncbi:MAG TPA: DUF1152 domain-containing protein [Terriglobales bacterium]|nr:DUF1152 domain-containing protein [Terriglobales bacterium]